MKFEAGNFVNLTTINKFEDIIAWRKARELTEAIYRIPESAFGHDFALRNQMRRASASIMSNIAEGFEREGNRELVQFLFIAKGSAGELRSQLYIAYDQGYVSSEDFERIFALANETSRTLKGFIRSLRKTEIKGQKYRANATGNFWMKDALTSNFKLQTSNC